MTSLNTKNEIFTLSRRRLSLFATGLCLLSLAGCTTVWTKPGASAAQFEGAKASCSAIASQQYQPVLVPMQISNGYTTPVHTKCSGGGNNIDCVTYGGDYVPPDIVMVDQNEDARNEAIRSCLIQQGWTPDR